ncbi:threonine--tRNA ligase [Candidatus Saccharibacteria bacterium]|nr:threonine--tRNA ligase [Candidatus Saccharibacteria bacterium]
MSDTQNNLYAIRHSLAHIMAAAIQHLWPEVKLGVGPVVENGFYYDIDLGPDTKIGEADFVRIEEEMSKIIAAAQPFEQFDMSVGEAVDWAQKYVQPYKEELLNDLQREGTTVMKELDAAELGLATDGDSKVERVSFYRNGDFSDLCRGPHVESTDKVGAFKLMRVAGAYWRGKEDNPQMQRIYGVAFVTEKELRSYLAMLEEAKKRDHRKLGKELDLFVISDLVGSGLPLFTPRGTVLREELGRFTQELREKNGFQRVWTPVIAKNDLYKTSGHWDKFGDELFLVKSQETSDEFVLRPMNCPHHVQIFASQPRSYRDMPLKLMENAGDYRDEKTGELHGLSRVRSFTQDDSHAFVRESQIKQVAGELVEAANYMYSVFAMELKFRLSFRDSGEGYLGDPALWDKAQASIEELAKENSLDYFIEEGEAAFYGPKIDFMATDAIGRQWQVATVQLDFVQPERFGLEFTNEDGATEQPVMIHCALLGSLERFLAVYIEHTAGRFPVWCSPEQVRLVSVNQEDQTLAFVDKLQAVGKEAGVRVTVDNSNESVGKKIRLAELEKVPYVIVLGEKEVAGGELLPRIRKDLVVNESSKSYTVEEFFQTVANEAKSRVSKTSL